MLGGHRSPHLCHPSEVNPELILNIYLTSSPKNKSACTQNKPKPRQFEKSKVMSVHDDLKDKHFFANNTLFFSNNRTHMQLSTALKKKTTLFYYSK